MSWKQTRAFSLAKMGRTKNFCLRNVRLGYGIYYYTIIAQIVNIVNNINQKVFHRFSTGFTKCDIIKLASIP